MWHRVTWGVMAPVLCPVIVGRDEELRLLGASLDAAREGRGGAIVISGEAGIGKTRLARSAEELASERGMLVLRGRVSAVDASTPYGALVDALQAAPAATRPAGDPELEPYRAALGHLLPLWEAGVPAAEARLLLPEATLRLLRHLAADAGVLLVVEDAQWADADTLALLDHVADHLRSERVLCVLTERSDTPGPAAEILAGMTGRRAAVRVALGPLAADEVAAMARLSLGSDEVPASVLGALGGRAEGVPFLVEEMLGAYVAAGRRAALGAEWRLSRQVADDLPASYRDLVRTRLATLDASSRRVLLAGAVLGRTFDWRLLGRIAGVGDADVLPALRAATQAQLITSPRGGDLSSFAFRHALARESVLAELLPPEIAELAQTAAETLEDAYPGLPGEWCNRAAALRVQAGDRLGASRLLLESARRAYAHGALATAESSLLRALDLVAGDYMAWLGPAELLVAVWSAAGKTDRLVDLARSLPEFFGRYLVRGSGFSGARTAQLHLAVARAALVSGEDTLADHHLSIARAAAAGGLADEEVELRLQTTGARVALARGAVSEARSTAAAVAVRAEGAGLIAVAVDAFETLGRAALSLGDLGAAANAFARAQALAHDGGTDTEGLLALVELATIDHLIGSAADRLDDARRIAVAAGAVSALARIELETAWKHLGLADRGAAGAALERGLDRARRYGLGLIPHLLVAEAHRRALDGDAPGVEGAVAEAVAAGRDDASVHAAAVGNGPALLLVLHGQTGEAAELLTEAARATVAGTPSAWWFPGLLVLLRRAAGGDGPTGPLPAHPANRAYAAYGQAIIAGREGRASDAARWFSMGDGLMPPGWRRHHARLVVAEAAVRDGWGDPGAWATDALAWAERSRLEPLAAAARRAMRRAGLKVRRRGRGMASVPDELVALGVTSREMDVLLQVAEGRSNQEIGERLFISPRTVESHIQSLMRKCSAGTRAELIVFAGAAARGLDAEPTG
jgi:DNA-binding CsgD family transcriptional regulator